MASDHQITYDRRKYGTGTGGTSLVGGERSLKLTVQESIGDEMALRKAEEAALRRYEAARWLRELDRGAMEIIPEEPSEEQLCSALRNGLILCNVLNHVNPCAVPKVVENPVITIQSLDGAAQSAIQYFENMRNFLVAVNKMDLLTFEASDIESGGASIKVVDCILCLKGYHEWKLAGSVGIWRYGSIVKISPSNNKFAKGPSNNTNLQMNPQMLEFLKLLMEVSLDESNGDNALGFLFEKFALQLVFKFFKEWGETEDSTLNEKFVEMLMDQAFKEFSLHLSSHRDKALGLLNKLMRGENGISTKSDFLEVILIYIHENKFDMSLNTCDSHGEKHERLDWQEKQLENLKSSFSEMKLQFESNQKKWNDDLKLLENNFQALERNSSSYQKLLAENRALYNQVQDLKGNIRVYCRVRPFLNNQKEENISIVDHIGENGDIIITNPNKQNTKDSRKIFSFNKVFGTNTSQNEVFMDTQPLVRSIMDGYNVCIFAYGQTGSGKTYTMSGPDIVVEETWGVNYRALNDLFKISKERSNHISYNVSVQMIEIYNEQVRDLLVSDGSNKRLEIRNNSQLNGLNVPDASLVRVKCTGDVLDLMKIGIENRAVGSTALNERSSRSHSVLTVHVTGTELISGTTIKGCLHLVDLAGSERVNKSEVRGERLNEAKHINKSLSALADVIAALAQKSSHVPYRNSKLTQVLQDALGGQAKTLMFVHVNPEKDSFCETLSTLKFAERVGSVELGAARVNKESGKIKDLKDEISRLKLALESKESEMLNIKISARNVSSEPRDLRPRSPLSASTNLKAENSQKLRSEFLKSEIRSSSSIKERRFNSSPSLTEKDSEKKTPINGLDSQNGTVNSRKSKTPIRISLSSGNSSLSKSKPKTENSENNSNLRKSWAFKENVGLVDSCVHIDAKNEMRRAKMEIDTEMKNSELSINTNVIRKTWFSKENESSRKTWSRNKEQRTIVREKEPFSEGKHENKPPCTERTKNLGVDVRCSRSLPRGKIMTT